MKFSCSNEHFYKKFIKSILDMEITYLIQDYLESVQYIHFDQDISNNSTSEISIKSNDIAALKAIINDDEIRRIMINRFVDGLKKMIENSIKIYSSPEQYHVLHIRLGEYREHLLSLEDEIQREISPELKLFEESFSDFKNNRDRAASVICKRLDKDDNFYYDPMKNKDSVPEKNGKNTLELLTHNRNINLQYKSEKNGWKNYRDDFIKHFDDLKDTKDLQNDIANIHKLLIGASIPDISSYKDIQKVLTINTDSVTFRKNSYQGYLKSQLWKIGQNKNYSKLLNDYGHNEYSNEPSKEYLKKLETRSTTIYNTLNQHLYKVPKGTFNMNNIIRISLYIEMHTLLTLNFRKGQLEEQESYLINNYINMLDESQNYLVYYKSGPDSELYLLMKKVIFSDLFGRSKFDAARLFSTTVNKMEEVLKVTLNNSNYNFASFNIVKLLKKFIIAFDEFINENDKLNRRINDTYVNTSENLPDLNKFKYYAQELEHQQLKVKYFTENYKFDCQENNLLLKTFNKMNTFEQKSK